MEKQAVFVHVSLNANELLLPAPYLEEGGAFTAPWILYQKLKRLFGFDYLYRAHDYLTLQFFIIIKVYRHAF